MHLALVSIPSIPKSQLRTTEALDRDVVAAIDQASVDCIDIGSVWDDLVSGYNVVADSFHAGDRCYFVLVPSSPVRLEPYQAARARRDLRLLHEFLMCGSQKQLRYDHDLSPATVTARMKRALSALGIDCCPSRLPPLLAMAAAARPAWSSEEQDAPPSSVPLHALRGTYRVVSMTRPDLELPVALSPALRSVLRLAIDGETHEQMSLRRSSARRTIANQLGSLFQILHASGRAELVTRLCRAKIEKNAYRARVSTCLRVPVERAAASILVAAG
jgi:DNA-binding CsgD family transcriptional regulator